MLHRLPGLIAMLVAALFAAAGPAAARPQLTTADFNLLHFFVQRAANAYSKPDRIRLMHPRTTRIATPGNLQVLYFIETDNERRMQVVAVRGTAASVNWDQDRDTVQVMDRVLGVPVHRGFHRIAQAILADALPYLRKDYSIYLTGHSMGGAVAGVLGMYLQAEGYRIGGLYTFGQPKFTDQAGARTYWSLPLVRVINQNDVVPMLPDNPKGGGRPYAQFGPEIILLAGPYYSWLDAHDASRRSVGQFRRMAATASLPDHHVSSYVRSVIAKLGEADPVPYASRRQYIERRRPVGSPSREDPVR